MQWLLWMNNINLNRNLSYCLQTEVDGRTRRANYHSQAFKRLLVNTWHLVSSKSDSPHLTQCCLGWGLPPYQVVSWYIQLFGHNRYSRNLGGLRPLFGERDLEPHLKQCGQGRGLPACQVSSWTVQPFGHSTPTLRTERTDRTGQTTVQ